METKQPVWKLVGNLGDVNVADYGGFLVYEDTTGIYPPEAELYQPNETEDTGGTVYRFVLERPRFKTLTEEGKRHYTWPEPLPANQRNVTWHWFNEWYVDKLKSVASTCGTTKFALLRLLFSKKTMKRAIGYHELIENFGPFEFDQYPLTLTQVEAETRYTLTSLRK